jgi:hypothetical protein
MTRVSSAFVEARSTPRMRPATTAESNAANGGLARVVSRSHLCPRLLDGLQIGNDLSERNGGLRVVG